MVSFDAQGKLSLKLNAQSPMVHFQAREPGATIRASEVKPKLDRYLIWKLKQQTGLDGAELAKSSKYKDWFRPSTDENVPPTALRYQMQIFCEEAPEIVVLNLDNDLKNKYKVEEEMARYAKSVSKYPIFYANSGVKDPKQQRLGIVSNPTVVIRCFNNALQKLIQAHLEDFFLVTNFGTMQSKGFGGFAPEEMAFNDPNNRTELRRAAELLKAWHGAKHCVLLPVTRVRGGTSFSSAIHTVECFYHLMKSGYNFKNTNEYDRSFLFKYIHKSPFNIGNEKEWMKKEGISPAIGRKLKLSPQEEAQPNYYVRALLGTASNVSYLVSENSSKHMSISISSKEIERAPSPIFFKVLGNSILVVASQVDKRLYNKPFTFEGYRSDTLWTPPENTPFDADAFLVAFANHYNELIYNNTLPIYLEGARTVKEVKPT